MHQKFADWYRHASAAPTLSELQARSAAAEGAGNHLNQNVVSVVDLVEVVFELGRNAKDVRWFVDAMKKADPTLPLEDNDNGLTVLAGCTLALLLESQGADWSDLATVIAAASFQGSRRPRTLPSLTELAKATIRKRQVDNRRAAEPKAVKTPVILTKELRQSLEALVEQPSPEGLAKGLSDLGRNLGTVPAAVEGLQASLDELVRCTELQREELDMVWTVLGGWVPALNGPLREVKRPAAGIVIGHQLADFTRVYPAPFALDAIIDRALAQHGFSDQAKISVETAIGAMPEGLLQAWSLPSQDLDRFGRVAPLLLAITKAREDQESWKKAFLNTTGLQVGAKLSIRDLARQAYDERLTIKQLG